MVKETDGVRLGRFIRTRAGELHINQDELIARIERAGGRMPKGTMSKWWNGEIERPKKWPFLWTLAEALECTPSNLFTAMGYDTNAGSVRSDVDDGLDLKDEMNDPGWLARRTRRAPNPDPDTE